MISSSVLCVGLCTSILGGASGIADPEVRLVVVVMIDQFRGDYLERFEQHFGSDGFKRLQREGAEFTNCHHGQAATQTACGHAVLLTGRYPHSTGIVANYRWDRVSNKPRPIVFDAEAPLLDAQGAGASPRALLGSHLSDALKKKSPRSKVISIAGKDRAAILMGGHQADGVYWWDKNAGRFITSTYYRREYPAWVAKFNASRPADKFFGALWTRALPASAYAALRPDDFAPEGLRTNLGRVFPHKLGGSGKPDPAFYADLLTTPFGNTLLLDMAWAAVEAEDLGTDEATDLLAVGLSANDYVGHRYGPESHEVMDLTIRTDRQLAEFLNKLDKQIGLEKCLVVLSSDHGIAPLVEYAKERGHRAARIDVDLLTEKAEAALRKRFGPAKSPYVSGWSDPYVYLNAESSGLRNVSRETFERVAADAVASIPGVELVCTRWEILGDHLPKGKVYDMIRLGFHPQLSGDLAVVFARYHTTVTMGTTHHGPHAYDTHVPLLLRGQGIKPGRYQAPAAPGDVAPTCAQLLGLTLPDGSDCRVLSEALAAPAAISSTL